MARWIRIAAFMGGLYILTGAAHAMQSPGTAAGEAGRVPLIQFSADDYEAHVQNWAARRLYDGTMVFANTSGVLTFDGTRWQTLPTPNGSLVRSLAQDTTGRVYVGAQGELGYLAPDSLGVLRYVSLMSHVPNRDRAFGNVWATVHTSAGVFFQTNQRLFQWVPGRDTMRIQRSAARFVHAFAVRDTLYVAEAGTGLLRHTANGTLDPVPGTDALSDDRVTVVLPMGPRDLLIGTMDRGLFRYDGRTLQPFPTAANALLREHVLYRGVALPEGRFAFATLRGGVLILRDDGPIERVIDTQEGLRDNTVTNLFADGEGGLWLTLNDGIARADWPAPFTSFGEANGLTGIVEDIARHDGRLYAATNRGLFVLSSAPGRAARFTPLPSPPTDCRSLLSVASDLLAGCGDGLYRIRGTNAVPMFESSSIRALAPAPFDSALVLAGDSDGLRRVERRGDRWVSAGHVAGLNQSVSTIAFAPDGAVWAGLTPEGVARVRNVTAPAPEVTGFRSGERGLPPGGVYLARGTEHPLFLTDTGLYRHLAGPDGTASFQPDTRFGPAFAGAPDGSPGRSALVAQADAQGNVWMFAWPDVGVARRQPDGSFQWEADPYHRARMPFVYAMHPDPDGTLWFGGTEGIVRYDPGQALPPPPPRRPIVHRMTPVGGDSVLYANAATHTPMLHYSENAVRFTYALPSYHRRTPARFQVQLDGFDAGWAAWTEETRKDYTNLPEGAYTFRVRGEDAFGQVSPERAVAFTILPPWYRTPWAYLLWGLLGAALVGGVGYGAARWRTRQLEARGRALEALVQARTEEVSRQNKQLEAQAERLAELDAVKSRFFANISHEFRTPLTLTLGPVEDILSGTHGPVQDPIDEKLRLVHRNASRLLRLINQLLDLARLETGHVPLEATRADLVEMLDRFVRVFAPLAERRQVTLAFESTEPRLPAYVDPDKLEKMIANLLSNAFKATDAGGTIRVRLRRTDAHAEIAVDDTGVGIAADDLPTIFDRFNQRLEGAAAGTGTGIGLNLTKEFVELHGGTVDVTSTPGVGTTFTVRLPLGRDHLRDDQVVDAPPDMTPPSPPPPMAPDGYATGADEHATPPAPSEDGPTVLIVDDNPDIRAYVRDQLTPRYHVVEAEDGVMGYERAKAVLPDCIISDVMMPHRDGYALTAELKADPALDHVPLILLTAKAEAEHKVEGLTAGADDYLTKPFNARELAARVHNLIASRHRLREKFSRPVVMTPSEVTVDSADEQFLQRVRETIESRMMDADFSVAALAEAAALSESQLQRKVKALTEQTPVQLIRTMRLERAAQLLEQEAGNITEIAYAVGFNSYAHFARSFKQHFGQSASEYMATA